MWNTHIELYGSGEGTVGGCHSAADSHGCTRVGRVRRKGLRDGGCAGCDSKGLGP